MNFEICMVAKIERGSNGYIYATPNDPSNAIQKVIFNDPATIVYWVDGTKTVVKASEGTAFDPEKGIAMAISKKFFGNRGNYYDVFRKYLKKTDSNDIVKNSTKPVNDSHHDETDLQTCISKFSRKSWESLDWFIDRFLKQN